VARCIRREVKEGRGSPHGGVYLDISWISRKLPNAAEHIRKKLPSMYHQFRELGDIDITKEPMEVGPTTHYAMGGIRVDADTQMSGLPGLFAAGECASGINGANRLGGNSLSDLLVFGKRAGEYAAQFAKLNAAGKLDQKQIQDAARESELPFSRAASGTNPYAVQAELQEMMQDLVGIVRREDEMRQALDRLLDLRLKAAQAGIAGHREYNNGWHTSIDLGNQMAVAEAITRSAIERKESRGGHFREDYPDKTEEFGQVSISVRRGPDGEMIVVREPIPEMPAELKQIIEEMK
jgi:succinate dehydrogenase / fumarate reductase flavoprotein subunit